MNRVAVVTGGASGLGAAICRHLVDAGNKVAVVDLATGVDVSDRVAVDNAHCIQAAIPDMFAEG